METTLYIAESDDGKLLAFDYHEDAGEYVHPADVLILTFPTVPSMIARVYRCLSKGDLSYFEHRGMVRRFEDTKEFRDIMGL